MAALHPPGSPTSERSSDETSGVESDLETVDDDLSTQSVPTSLPDSTPSVVISKSFDSSGVVLDGKPRRATGDQYLEAESETARSSSVGPHSSTTKTRERKRRQKKQKMKEISKGHPEFELAYCLLLGVRVASSFANRSIVTITDAHDSDDDMHFEDELRDEFTQTHKLRFPSKGSEITPAHVMTSFEFKDYCRPIFAQLREWFGIQPEVYLTRLCGGFNLLEFISNSKSGQFFFYSHDGQFLIKSMAKSEAIFLRKILPQYYNYVQRQPHTLLTKFFGMYRIKPGNKAPIYFVVMGSVFYTDLEIHRIYDLKGSTKGRNATDREKQQEVPVLKDLDFLDDRQMIRIGKGKSKLLKQQIRRDTEFLRKLKIMDYSLLLGIHYRDRPRMDTFETPLDSDREVQSDSEDPDDILAAFPVETEEKQRVPQDSFLEDMPPLEVPPPETEESIPNEQIVGVIAREGRTVFMRQSSVPTSQGSQDFLGLPAHGRSATARRLSQIGLKNHYSVATPVELSFDAPDIDIPRVFASDDEKQTSDANPYTSVHGGMCYEGEDGEITNEVYFAGIIDILQKYNKRKKVENFFRGLQNDQMEISAVPPELYAQRMVDFLKDRIC